MDSFELWDLLRVLYEYIPELLDSLKHSEHSEHFKHSNTLNRVEHFESVRLPQELEGV